MTKEKEVEEKADRKRTKNKTKKKNKKERKRHDAKLEQEAAYNTEIDANELRQQNTKAREQKTSIEREQQAANEREQKVIKEYEQQAANERKRKAANEREQKVLKERERKAANEREQKVLKERERKAANEREQKEIKEHERQTTNDRVQQLANQASIATFELEMKRKTEYEENNYPATVHSFYNLPRDFAQSPDTFLLNVDIYADVIHESGLHLYNTERAIRKEIRQSGLVIYHQNSRYNTESAMLTIITPSGLHKYNIELATRTMIDLENQSNYPPLINSDNEPDYSSFVPPVYAQTFDSPL